MCAYRTVMLGCCPQTKTKIIKPIVWKVIYEDKDNALLMSSVSLRPI